jgi:hypothetical protein
MYLSLKLKFKFKSLIGYCLKQVLFATCKGTSNFYIQVSQTLWKDMSRKNFSEFTRFFRKDLNPFKIQERFKLEFVPKFITGNPVGI